MFLVIPNSLRDEINRRLDEQIALAPDAEADREVLYNQLVHYFNENGVIPDFSLVKKDDPHP